VRKIGELFFFFCKIPSNNHCHRHSDS
jgi:hypothetical protein